MTFSIPVKPISKSICVSDGNLLHPSSFPEGSFLSSHGGRERDTHLPLGGRDRDIHLPPWGRERDNYHSLGGRDRNFHLPLGGREREFHHSVGIKERDSSLSCGGWDSEAELVTFANPRHFIRRGGVVGNINVSGIQKMVSV